MAKNYYLPGQFNLYCDSCAIKYKAQEAKKRWDGLIVCPKCYEERQPQDFVKAKLDKIAVPFARPSDPLIADFPIGMADIVPIRETPIAIFFTANYDIVETVPVMDVVQIQQLVGYYDVVHVEETLVLDTNYSEVITDYAKPDDSGGYSLLDYADQTYFAEIYVVAYTISFY